MQLRYSNISVVSFDIGNTLVNLDNIIGFCSFFCRETKLSVDSIRGILNDYFLKRKVGLEESVQEVCKILGIDHYQSIISKYNCCNKETVVFPDVIPTLTKLHQAGYKIIACSNCVKWDANDPNGVLHRNVSDIFYSFEIGYAKPEKEFFDYVSSFLHVKGQEILHVGDSLKADYYGAINAGWKAVLLDRNGKNNDPSVECIETLFDLFRNF